MIRKLGMILGVSVITIMSLGLTECGPVKEYESGFFKYKYEYYSEENIMISGLTDLGEEQKFLTIPTEIDGKR